MKSRAVSDYSAKLPAADQPIRILEQESEVIRRTVAYLSRDVNPEK